MVDLHVHSTKSDGSLTPTELVAYARKQGVHTFALTDHDTVDGIAEARSAAKDQPVKVIPGIELSVKYKKVTLHLLGLYIDDTNTAFRNKLTELVNARTNRNQKICQKLQEHGAHCTYEELLLRFPNKSVLTRAHFAVLLIEKGYVKSKEEAFARYIGESAPCYLPKEKLTPTQGVQLLLSAGGLPILAHPLLYGFTQEQLHALLAELKAAGLVGIEAIYSLYTKEQERLLKAMAKEHGLGISGGSDFHGALKPGLALGTGYGGGWFVPDEMLEGLGVESL